MQEKSMLDLLHTVVSIAMRTGSHSLSSAAEASPLVLMACEEFTVSPAPLGEALGPEFALLQHSPSLYALLQLPGTVCLPSSPAPLPGFGCDHNRK